ncbi:UPF0261 domain protein [Ganoderma leucocontextum]|nr:UPF0261 domain protein [Ganoderma leucocontextum]
MSQTTPNPPSSLCVAILGTCDTKLDELLYVRTHLLEVHHVRVKLVDVGRTPTAHPAINIKQSSILATSPSTDPTESGDSPTPDISILSRNQLIIFFSARAGALLASLASAHDIHGLIALGGSGGSALAAGVFRALPLGFPKLLVSTMAAGDISPFVQDSDVAVMYSVTDIAGLNDILCPILENAAGAVAGMARAYHARVREMSTSTHAPGGEVAARRDKGKRIAITMFGVTTPAVTHARTLLAKYDCTPYVFHATGAGGRALERLTSAGFFDGVLDLTTTELADELVGGVLTAGPRRLEAAARKGAPQVVSLGALDMVNFGPINTVPEKWKTQGRKLYVHNPSVTVMRTTPEECAQLGRIIAEKLRDAGATREKTEVWVPRGGVSALSVGGAAFEDREADEALFRALKDGLRETIRVVERGEDINNPDFVAGVVDSLVRMMDLEVAGNR